MVDRLRKGTDTWKFIDRRTRTKAGRAQGEGPSEAGVVSQQLDLSSSAHQSMESRVSENAGSDGRTNQLESRGGAGQSASNENAGSHAAKSNKATEAEKQESSNIARDRNKKKAGKFTSKRPTQPIVQRVSANPLTDPDSSDSSDSSENESTDPSGDESSSSSDDDSSDDEDDRSSGDSDDDGDDQPAGEVGEPENQSPAESQKQSDGRGSQTSSWHGFSPSPHGSDDESQDGPHSMRGAPGQFPRAGGPADNDSRLPSGGHRDLKYEDAPGLRRATDDSSSLSRSSLVDLYNGIDTREKVVTKRKRASTESDIPDGGVDQTSAGSAGKEQQSRKRRKREKSKVVEDTPTAPMLAADVRTNVHDDMDWRGSTKVDEDAKAVETWADADIKCWTTWGLYSGKKVKKMARKWWKKTKDCYRSPPDILCAITADERARRADGRDPRSFPDAAADVVASLSKPAEAATEEETKTFAEDVHMSASGHDQDQWTQEYMKEVRLNEPVMQLRAMAKAEGVWGKRWEAKMAKKLKLWVERDRPCTKYVKVLVGLAKWRQLHPSPEKGAPTETHKKWKRENSLEQARLWRDEKGTDDEDEDIEADDADDES